MIAGMGNIGLPEMIFIFVIALLVFGPKKLPELGRSLGKGIAEFRRASAELRNSLEHEIQSIEQETKTAEQEIKTTDQENKGAEQHEYHG